MEVSLIAVGDRPENYTFRLFKALLEREGYRVNLIYLNVCRMDEPLVLTPRLKEQLVDLIKDSGVVGIYVFTFNFFTVVEITQYIRNKTRALILWGGPHAIAEPEECARYADIVCFNEGEEALLKIAKEYHEHGRSFSRIGIPNIAYMESEKIVFNETRKLSFLLDTLPYQDYSFKRHYYVNEKNELVPLTLEELQHKFGHFRYITIIARGVPAGVVFVSTAMNGVSLFM